MTGRITAAFLGVLLAVIAAIVIPLGAVETRQQRHDYLDAAASSAGALAAVVEERLDDSKPDPALTGQLARAARQGDDVAVLDAAGRVVARAGARLPAEVLRAARESAPLPPLPDRILVRAAVGTGARQLGQVVLSRDTAPLEARRHHLWLALGGAAAAALLVGAAVGWLLGRWIGRPLRALAGAAHGLGANGRGARADVDSGPPQVREVAIAFNEMADRVASLLDAQARTTADISHQLRTPLAALRLRLDLLMDEVHGDARAEVTAMITETARLARLADGLLAVARAEAVAPAPEPSDAGAVAAERVAAWQPIAAERGLVLKLVRSRTARALITPGHLEQALDNVLANAVEAVGDGGRVTVTVENADAGRAAREVVVRVADDGPGMPEELRARAFERFVADRATGGGTGLGLAIAGRLVAADHGSALLRETLGGGLTVEFFLPVADRSERHRPAPAAPDEPASADAVDSDQASRA